LQVRDLADTELFCGLPESLTGRFAGLALHRRLRRRQRLAFSGQEDDAVFLVKSGRIKISYLSEEGRELTVMVLYPGQLYSRHSEATVTALDDCELWIFLMPVFKQILAADPAIPLRLIRILGHILRKTNDALQNLAFREVSSRRAKFLLGQASENGAPAADGRAFSLRFTHEEIANIIGSTRQTVTSILNRWDKNKIIAAGRHQVVILDRARLEEMLG
jgi:CRP-like cAMP-binding protein